MVSFSFCFGAIAFVLGIVCIPENNCYSLTSYVTPCHGLDSECLTNKANEYFKEFAKGIPELKIPPLDPLTIDKSDLKLGTFVMNLENIVGTGLRKCNTQKLDMSLKTHKFSINVICNVTLTGKYKSKGQLLALNMDGDGDAKFKIRRMSIKVDVGYAFEKRDGEHYIKLNKEYKLSTKVLGYAHYDLTNLFGGRKELSDPVLAILNQNWEQLFNELSGPIVKQAVDQAVEHTRKFFDTIPRSVLTPGFDELYKDQQ